MSKIIYFTTAQNKNDFASFLTKWKVSPNLSNQNFHNKLIRSLALTKNVDVISVRPINKNYSEKKLEYSTNKEGKITWKYIKVTNNRIDKKLFLKGRIASVEKNVSSDDIVIVDTLNLSLLKNAYSFAKKNKLKIIGVCTDNPKNISFTSESYKEKLLKISRKLDAFICLTQKLDELYNLENKPSVIIDGVNEDNIVKHSNYCIDGQYIFFGGSLMHEYGVHNLIKAFDDLNRDDLKLVICGHHEENGFKQFLKSFNNVIYLGALNYDDVSYLEQHALIAVNPRPINPDIDDYSIPSKTLEYLSNGVLTIATENTQLKDNYGSAIIWAKSSSVEDLKNALEQALDLSEEETNQIKKLAKELVNKRTSLENINKLLETLF